MLADMQGYLKVNKVRLTVGAEKNIAALVHVKINDVTLVYLPQQLQEFIEETIRQFFILFEGAAFYVFINEPRFAIVREKAWYSMQMTQLVKDRYLVTTEELTQPR